MSDVMLLGVLSMPLPDNPAEIDTMTWLQFRARARQAAQRISADAQEIERLKRGLNAARNMFLSRGEQGAANACEAFLYGPPNARVQPLP